MHHEKKFNPSAVAKGRGMRIEKLEQTSIIIVVASKWCQLKVITMNDLIAMFTGPTDHPAEEEDEDNQAQGDDLVMKPTVFETAAEQITALKT